MDGLIDTRPSVASSQPEGSGSLDEEGVIQRVRRDTVYDWPSLVDKHNALRRMEKGSNMEFMVSLKRLVV